MRACVCAVANRRKELIKLSENGSETEVRGLKNGGGWHLVQQFRVNDGRGRKLYRLSCEDL